MQLLQQLPVMLPLLQSKAQFSPFATRRAAKVSRSERSYEYDCTTTLYTPEAHGNLPS